MILAMRKFLRVLGRLRWFAAQCASKGNASPLRRAGKHLELLVNKRISAAPPEFEIYQGLYQRCGHLGDVQDDFNLTGHVHANYPLKELMFCVNGGTARPLNFKPIQRIIEYGDFNADIPVAMFMPGANRIVLTATDITGTSKSVEVTVFRAGEGSYPLPASICWKNVTDLQDAGLITDGKWTIVPEGLRTIQVGYDRVFMIGNRTWVDYEASAAVTIHGMSARNGRHSGDVKHVGFCFRWAGNSIREGYAGEQPKCGVHPRGGIVWLTITRERMPPERQFWPGDSETFQSFSPFEVGLNEPFRMKGSCETLGPETTRYSFKVWRMDAAEPVEWDFQVVQRCGTALKSGALALVAHELDVTFGDIQVRALAGPHPASEQPDAATPFNK